VGAVTALLGANGAGKSTLARAVAGLVRTATGQVTFDGHDITHRPAHEIRRLGLAYLQEGRGIFRSLSVSDNLCVAVATLPKQERAAAIDRAIEFFPVLGERRAQIAGKLSGGQQQMLSLARLMADLPRLVGRRPTPAWRLSITTWVALGPVWSLSQPTREGSTMGFTVDRDRCVGSAYCQGIAPDVFDLDETGLAYVISPDPSDSTLEAARRAVRECPSMSIREESDGDTSEQS
jgi:ferredoxin/ABC-type histidine transport system ATPase subunit